MSKKKSETDIINHKNKTITILSDYMDSLIDTDPKKVDLLSYWLHTYTNYLKFEDMFDPKKNKRYERGDIVQVNLGFNVGSEHGGLHYAVVLDNNNNHSSPVLTIIPLSSSNGANIHVTEVFLGDDIYQKLKSKISGIKQAYTEQIDEIKSIEQMIQETILSIEKNKIDNDEGINTLRSKLELLKIKKNNAEKKKSEADKIAKEINKMNRGSVALVNQITTISKIRIVDPIHNQGVLNGIKLSPNNLDNINKKIIELFLRN